MDITNALLQTLQQRPLIIDGAMGTQLQALDISSEQWEGNEGCNELLNVTAPELIASIHANYLEAGADFTKTNSFGAFSWVLDEYDIAERAYELAFASAAVAKAQTQKFSTPSHPRYTLGVMGPGTKLPSLGHIEYDEMLEGYTQCAQGLFDGGADAFLLETMQDPLQIKAAIHAVDAVLQKANEKRPILVSATIELSGSMLIGTDAQTIAAILEPFEIFSLGFNCGTGPSQYLKHVKALSEYSPKRISVHANAGLPENRGGQSYYPMGPDEFAASQKSFLACDGVQLLGGCCGTTPAHIKALHDAVCDIAPKPPVGKQSASIASLFNVTSLMQEPAPLLVGERSNATGSKAFRELLLHEDYEGTLTVAQQQVRAGAHALDVSVGFAGRDEQKDMHDVMAMYAQKIALPLMPDSTQLPALEMALKKIGGKPIINSVNLEDGIEKFDAVCSLAKRYGASLVCLTIDEEGMAKTKARKVEVAQRIYDRAVNLHKIRPDELVFDLLTFTVGSGDEEYRDAAIQTIDAIRELRSIHPEVGAILGLSNISFGLDAKARPYLNSVFLHHCIEAGLTAVIINVKHIIPLSKMKQEDIDICEELLFNKKPNGEALFAFIEHFATAKEATEEDDEAYNALSGEEKIKKLLMDGDKERMLPLVEQLRHEIAPERIVNEILIDAMKVVGELFGAGQMQLPFVLQSAETMKATVDVLNPYLPKLEKKSLTTLVLGTVKGDVHDVGKNLVDIILSNNGFKVINLGIKVHLETFLEELKKSDADAIGMSGLLVKSTQVMKENLEALSDAGFTKPILLGGAALTRSFIDEYCRPIYKGPIFYCKDAFDGVTAMSRIEKGDMNTVLHPEVDTKEKKEKKKVVIPPLAEIKMPSRDIAVVIPPFWGERTMTLTPQQIELAFEWVNHKVLFKQRWGYSSKGQDKTAYKKMVEEKLWPAFEALKKLFLEQGLFEPAITYGYWPVRSNDQELLIFDAKEGYHSIEQINQEPLQDIIGRAIEVLSFPRQERKPHRALSDFFSHEHHDLIALTCVSAGSKLSEYEKTLYNAGKYTDYYQVHGLGVELAEALAEMVHKQIRMDLNITANEKASLSDVRMNRYQGARYSFGYPACPDLEQNRVLFDLLKPERLGITLSETFQIHPEQSTSALVVYHPEATYYSI